jgi:hypothetical protein
VGFEPTIPAFERSKTVHVLDGAASVIGMKFQYACLIFRPRSVFNLQPTLLKIKVNQIYLKFSYNFSVFCLVAVVSLSKHHCVDFYCLDDLRSGMGVCVYVALEVLM